VQAESVTLLLKDREWCIPGINSIHIRHLFHVARRVSMGRHRPNAPLRTDRDSFPSISSSLWLQPVRNHLVNGEVLAELVVLPSIGEA
jgi:hypothetical protein